MLSYLDFQLSTRYFITPKAFKRIDKIAPLGIGQIEIDEFILDNAALKENFIFSAVTAIGEDLERGIRS